MLSTLEGLNGRSKEPTSDFSVSSSNTKNHIRHKSTAPSPRNCISKLRHGIPAFISLSFLQSVHAKLSAPMLDS